MTAHDSDQSHGGRASSISAFEGNKINQIINDVSIVITIKNFATCELPLPIQLASSFATLTRQIKKHKINILQQTKNK